MSVGRGIAIAGMTAGCAFLAYHGKDGWGWLLLFIFLSLPA